MATTVVNPNNTIICDTSADDTLELALKALDINGASTDTTTITAGGTTSPSSQTSSSRGSNAATSSDNVLPPPIATATTTAMPLAQESCTPSPAQYPPQYPQMQQMQQFQQFQQQQQQQQQQMVMAPMVPMTMVHVHHHHHHGGVVGAAPLQQQQQYHPHQYAVASPQQQQQQQQPQGYPVSGSNSSGSSNSNSKRPCNVIVAGLLQEMGEDDVRQLFSRFGTILSAVVKIDLISGKSRGFGFVRYALPEDAERAVTAMHRTRLGPNVLNVELSKHDGHIPEHNAIFVRMWPESINEEATQRFFCRFGNVLAVRRSVDRESDETTERRGYRAHNVTVAYSRVAEARAAVAALHGTFIELDRVSNTVREVRPSLGGATPPPGFGETVFPLLVKFAESVTTRRGRQHANVDHPSSQQSQQQYPQMKQQHHQAKDKQEQNTLVSTVMLPQNAPRVPPASAACSVPSSSQFVPQPQQQQYPQAMMMVMMQNNNNNSNNVSSAQPLAHYPAAHHAHVGWASSASPPPAGAAPWLRPPAPPTQQQQQQPQSGESVGWHPMAAGNSQFYFFEQS